MAARRRDLRRGRHDHDAERDRGGGLAALNATPAGAAIHTVALAKSYGGVAALRDLTLSVGRGEVFGFLGPNGAGKTTAVKLMLGLAQPTAGSGSLLGAPIGDRATRMRIGYLPELFRYQEWLSAREVLAFHAALAGIAHADRSACIADALQTVGLAARARDRVGTFSKGMQQRLGLGVALLGTPELVFLDEPTSALDPVGRHDVRTVIESLRARGATVFLNSHLLTEVERICDRVAVVDRGTVVAQGTVDALTRDVACVRLRLRNVTAAALALLAAGGAPRIDGDVYTKDGVADRDVPALVAALVAAGVEVYAVEPTRVSLEERFLQLLTHDEPADDRIADPA